MKINDKAPEFALKDTNGKIFRLKDFKGKYIALYFYPKDMTPGCTKEACNLRDNYSELLKRNITIIGISVDNMESHDKFRKKYSLQFKLLCDTDGSVSKIYGVYKKQSFLGKTYYGIKRTTFIINKERKIHAIITNVDVDKHADQIIGVIND